MARPKSEGFVRRGEARKRRRQKSGTYVRTPAARTPEQRAQVKRDTPRTPQSFASQRPKNPRAPRAVRAPSTARLPASALDIGQEQGPRLKTFPITPKMNRRQRQSVIAEQAKQLGFTPDDIAAPEFRDAIDTALKSPHDATRRAASQLLDASIVEIHERTKEQKKDREIIELDRQYPGTPGLRDLAKERTNRKGQKLSPERRQQVRNRNVGEVMLGRRKLTPAGAPVPTQSRRAERKAISDAAREPESDSFFEDVAQTVAGAGEDLWNTLKQEAFNQRPPARGPKGFNSAPIQAASVVPLAGTRNLVRAPFEIARTYAEDVYHGDFKALQGDAKFILQTVAGVAAAPVVIAKGGLDTDKLWTAIKADYKERYGEAFAENPNWKKFREIVRKHGGLSYAVDFAGTIGAAGGKAVGAAAKTGRLGRKAENLVTMERPEVRFGHGEGATRRQRGEAGKAAPNIIRAYGNRKVDNTRQRVYGVRARNGNADLHPGDNEVVAIGAGRLRKQYVNQIQANMFQLLRPRQGRLVAPLQKDLKKMNAAELAAVKYVVQGVVPQGGKFHRPGAEPEIAASGKVFTEQQERHIEGLRATAAPNSGATAAERQTAQDILEKIEGKAAEVKVKKPSSANPMSEAIDEMILKIEAHRNDGNDVDVGELGPDELPMLKQMRDAPDQFFTPAVMEWAERYRHIEKNETAPRDPALHPVQAELRRRAPQAHMLGIQRIDGESNIDYIDRVADAAEEAGLPEPAYWPSTEFDKSSPAVYAPGSGLAASGDTRSYAGKLSKAGREAANPELAIEGLLRSVKRGVQWPAIDQMVRKFAHKKSGRDGMRIRDIQRLIRDEKLDASKWAIWVPKKAKEWVADEHIGARIDDLDIRNAPEVEAAILKGTFSADELGRYAETGEFSGVRAFLVPKDVIDELTPSIGPMGKTGRRYDIANSKISRAMFFANLPWLIANGVSNFGLAAADGVGVKTGFKSMAEWKKLSPEAKEVLAPFVQVHTRSADLMERQLGSMAGPIAKTYRDMRSTGIMSKRPIHEAINKWMDLEKKLTTEPALKAAFYKEMKNDKNFKALDKSMGAANEVLATRLSDVFDMPKAKQAKFLEDHQDDLLKYADHVQEALGNWSRMSQKERVFYSRAIFVYPWVRFSLRMTFYTLPKNHPTLFAIIATMTRVNEEELQDIFPGLSIPADMLSKVALGDDVVDTTKLNPAGNSIAEMFSSGDFDSLLGLAPPLVGATVNAITGHNISQGMRNANIDGKTGTKDTKVQLDDRLSLLMAGLLDLPYITREIKRFRARGKQSDEATFFRLDPIKYKDADAIARNEQRKRRHDNMYQTKNMMLRFLALPTEEKQDILAQLRARLNVKTVQDSTTDSGFWSTSSSAGSDFWSTK